MNHVCPVDLECCNRAACAGGECRKSHEITLMACVDCGELIERRRLAFCVVCIGVEAAFVPATAALALP